MSRRTRYEVRPTSKTDLRRNRQLCRWTVARDGERLATFERKADAVQFATTTARCAWRTCGQLGQVLIKARTGKIRDERTYGRDPATTKG